MHDCLHEKCEPRRHVKSNNITVVRLQCLDCGRSLRELPKSEHQVELLAVFDLSIQERLEAKQNQEWQAEQERHRLKESDWWKGYNSYLETDHWRRIREIVTLRDHNCQICFHNRATQAHHVSYESYKKFGKSFSVECVGLCKFCHDSIHANGWSV